MGRRSALRTASLPRDDLALAWRPFRRPQGLDDPKRYDPDPEAVAKALGLPEDQTAKGRFKLAQ